MSLLTPQEKSYYVEDEYADIDKNNKMTTKLLAIHLYLLPEYVVTISLRFIGHYTGFETNSIAWFDSFVSGMLSEPLRFEITGFRGKNQTSIVLFMRIFGSYFHSIPTDCFLEIPRDNTNMISIHQFLTEILTYKNNCFYDMKTQELEAELKMCRFKYNNIMSSIFRPEFFIITVFRNLMVIILEVFKKNNGINFIPDFLNRIINVLSKYEGFESPFTTTTTTENIVKEEIRCFERNMVDKKSRTIKSLNTLKSIVNSSTNIRKLFDDIYLLWKEEAEDAHKTGIELLLNKSMSYVNGNGTGTGIGKESSGGDIKNLI